MQYNVPAGMTMQQFKATPDFQAQSKAANAAYAAGAWGGPQPGQAQPKQQQSQGTSYNPQGNAPNMSAYGGQQPLSEWRTQPSPGTGYANDGHAQFLGGQQGMGQQQGGFSGFPQVPAFQFRGTDFMGNQFNDPTAMTNQQGAMAQALNQQRMGQIGNLFTQGTPMSSLDPMAAYRQGQQMIQDGFQNPFAQPQMYQQPGGFNADPAATTRYTMGMGQQPGGQQQPQGGQFQDLFQQFGFAPPPGFMDALIQRLGGQQGPQPGFGQPGMGAQPGGGGRPQSRYQEWVDAGKPGTEGKGFGAVPGQSLIDGTHFGYAGEASIYDDWLRSQQPGGQQPGMDSQWTARNGGFDSFGMRVPYLEDSAGRRAPYVPPQPGRAQPTPPPSQGTPYDPGWRAGPTPPPPNMTQQQRNLMTLTRDNPQFAGMNDSQFNSYWTSAFAQQQTADRAREQSQAAQIAKDNARNDRRLQGWEQAARSSEPRVAADARRYLDSQRPGFQPILPEIQRMQQDFAKQRGW
jgi:hypothetical protein